MTATVLSVTNTRARRLVDQLMGGGLDAYVARQRDAGTSWDQLSRAIEQMTGEVVTDNTLRRWYPPADRQSPAA